MKPLPFPAEANHLQILSQRFIYALTDRNTLRMGDILIDSTKLKLDIPTQATGARLSFSWPAALMSEGRITLLNNNGKALWSDRFDAKKLAIAADKSVDDEDIRSDIARFTSPPLPEALLAELRRLPFMNFCVSNETDDTKIYLCSADLYWAEASKGHRVVRQRDFARLEAGVTINGQQVTPQGIVYLNEPGQELFMEAHTESGASIEIITRKNDIEFIDAVMSEDGKRVLLTSRGAEPTRKNGVRKLGPGEYQVALSAQRPYYYLMAAGGIPLRQEFLVRGELPKESQRVQLRPGAPQRSYSSSLTLDGIAPAGATLSPADDKSEVDNSGREFSWTLKQLGPGSNKRQLAIEAGGQRFTGQYEVLRARPREASLDMTLHALTQIGRADLNYLQWMDRFFGLGGSAAEFHWGWSLGYRKQLNNKPDDVPELDFITAGLTYRFNDGVPFEERTWGTSLLFSSVKVNKENSTAIGLEVFLRSPPPEEGRFASLLHWWDAKVRLWPVASGSVNKLATSWETDVQGYRRLTENSYWRAGAGLSQFKTNLALPKEGVQLDLKLGYLVNF